MTSREQLIKARVGMLALADELKDVARVCKLAGVSRSQFYTMKKAYETYGREGLAPKVRRKPTMPNRTPDPIERKILSTTKAYPSVSYLKLAEQMNAEGVTVTQAMVRYVWQRHGLSTRSARLRWVRRQHGSRDGMKGSGTDNTLEIGSAECFQVVAPPPLCQSLNRYKGETIEPDTQRVQRSITK